MTPSLLAQWAKREFGFVPKKGGEDTFKRYGRRTQGSSRILAIILVTIVVFSRLCVGAMSDRWAYLVRHVKSREGARHVRDNLGLERQRRRAGGSEEKTDEGGPEAEERRELQAEIARAEERLAAAKDRDSAAEAAVRRHRAECIDTNQVRRKVSIKQYERM